MLALKVIAPLVFEVGSSMFRRDTGKGDGDNDDSEANVIGGDNIVNMMIWSDLQWVWWIWWFCHNLWWHIPLVTALIAHLAHPVIGGGDDECDQSMMVKIMNKMDILNKSSDICF